MLEKLFKLKEHNTTVQTEIIAGITIFLTMVYIVIVNPLILSETGMDRGAVFVATCLAAAAGCFIMGLLANYPIAQAPGMGLNAFFTYAVVLQMGYSWQIALTAVFLSGVLFILLSIFKIREWIINSIPHSLFLGISAGIGIFIALIALKGAGIIVADKATLVTLGDMKSFSVVMAIIGFLITIALAYRDVKPAAIIAILFVTLVALIAKKTQYNGIVSAPPSLAPTFFKLNFDGFLKIELISVVFVFLFVDLFDTAGTLVGVAQNADLLDENGKLPRLRKALLSDSIATVVGSLFGTSTTTSYIESVSGVAVGGRTGLTAVVVGILFLLCTLFAPLASMVPTYATAGALIYVGVLMMRGLGKVEWKDLTEAVPVAVASIMIPLTYSIANGIALSFITYALIKLLTGKAREVKISVWVIATLFIIKFIYA